MKIGGGITRKHKGARHGIARLADLRVDVGVHILLRHRVHGRGGVSVQRQEAGERSARERQLPGNRRRERVVYVVGVLLRDCAKIVNRVSRQDQQPRHGIARQGYLGIKGGLRGRVDGGG